MPSTHHRRAAMTVVPWASIPEPTTAWWDNPRPEPASPKAAPVEETEPEPLLSVACHCLCNCDPRPNRRITCGRCNWGVGPSCNATVSWNDANWRRIVNEFFLREINAHRCTRSNLSRGSASAMRMLRLVLWENHPRLRHRLHRHTCACSYEQISYHLRLERFCLCIWTVPLLLGSFEPLASVDCNGLETTRYAQ